MNHYDLSLSDKVLDAIALLRAGVAAVGVIGVTIQEEGCSTCFLRLESGVIVQLCPTEHHLERRFEVFPIHADLVLSSNGIHWCNVDLDGPLEVFLLQTEEWLDATASCDGALGEGPMLQCQGIPGSVPTKAKASVRYVGGVELVASNGSTLTVVSLIAPYVMHVSGYASSEQFDCANYARVALNSVSSL